jgi:hypothetical protein
VRRRKSVEQTLSLVEGAVLAARLLQGGSTNLMTPFDADTNKKNALSAHIKALSPDLSEYELTIFLCRVGLALSRFDQGIQSGVDLRRLRKRLEPLVEALNAVEEAWSAIQSDKEIYRAIGSGVGLRSYVMSSDRTFAQSDDLVVVNPLVDARPGEKEAFYRQFGAAESQLKSTLEWWARVESALGGDLRRFREKASNLMRSLSKCTVRTSPFRYACVWGIADAWTDATGKLPTISRSGDLLPFQRCIKLIFAENESLSDVVNNVVDAFREKYSA